MTRSHNVTLSVLIALAAVVFGCAEPVEDINLVQHITRRSIFGSWLKQTVVDMSPESSMGFIGLEAELEKIEWKITEDASLQCVLTNRSWVELGMRFSRAPVEGTQLAAPVISHFDIRRSYNASAGEETNVIVENAVDRPWYERQYMREIGQRTYSRSCFSGYV